MPPVKFAYGSPLAKGPAAPPGTLGASGTRKPRTNGTSAARIGLVLLDVSLKPVFYNAEAFRILSYPNKPARSPEVAFARLGRALALQMPDADIPITTHVLSGRRRYVCRAFGLEPASQAGAWPTIAVTLERDSLLREQVARFQLTDREFEVVQHLVAGLTSKEIAQEMNISLNTVKTFVRLVMLKMSVTTRAGVIGKLVRGAPAGGR
jgi:DNA-binding CsgD family transcriptional regulator